MERKQQDEGEGSEQAKVLNMQLDPYLIFPVGTLYFWV